MRTHAHGLVAAFAAVEHIASARWQQRVAGRFVFFRYWLSVAMVGIGFFCGGKAGRKILSGAGCGHRSVAQLCQMLVYEFLRLRVGIVCGLRVVCCRWRGPSQVVTLLQLLAQGLEGLVHPIVGTEQGLDFGRCHVL